MAMGEKGDLLAKLPDLSRTKIAEEIGYKDGWKRIGLHFQPEVKYEVLTKKYPHLMFMGGDIAYCKAMIDALADQNITMGDFLDAMDESGLKASASKFRKEFITLDMMVEVVDYT